MASYSTQGTFWLPEDGLLWQVVSGPCLPLLSPAGPSAKQRGLSAYACFIPTEFSCICKHIPERNHIPFQTKMQKRVWLIS